MNQLRFGRAWKTLLASCHVADLEGCAALKRGRVTGSSPPVRRTTGDGHPPCLADLTLRSGAAEPVIETGRADARVVAGDEGLIVQLQAVVACVDIRDHLTWILGRAQESSDEFVERQPFGTGQLLKESPSQRTT